MERLSQAGLRHYDDHEAHSPRCSSIGPSLDSIDRWPQDPCLRLTAKLLDLDKRGWMSAEPARAISIAGAC